MCSLISINFEVLFASSTCMLCKTLLIPENSRIWSSVFCDASCVLIWISSAKDESSINGILPISMSVCLSVGNPSLSLVAALKDISNAGGVYLISIPYSNLSLNVFGVKNWPVHLLISDCQCLPSKNDNNNNKKNSVSCFSFLLA